MVAAVLAQDPHPGFVPPSIDEFYPPPIVEFHLFGVDFAITRITIWNWVTVLVLLLVFVTAARKSQIVPGRLQFATEGAYNFIRDGVARDVIGPEGRRFAPYLATLFLFIVMNNLLAIIPFAQLPPTSKYSIPLFLAVISWVIYLWVGIRKEGFFRYFKNLIVIPNVPWPMHILLIPIEFLQKIFVRPFTLSVRLFANMFAGHLLLVVFTLAGFYLLGVPNYSVIFFPFSLLMALALTFFELLVIVLQAYVFTILTASYLQESVSGGH